MVNLMTMKMYVFLNKECIFLDFLHTFLKMILEMQCKVKAKLVFSSGHLSDHTFFSFLRTLVERCIIFIVY